MTDQMTAADTAMQQRLLPHLPDTIIDIHSHVWSPEKSVSIQANRGPQWPMRVAATNTNLEMKQRLARLFPGKQVIPVVFSSPSIQVDTDYLNEEVLRWSQLEGWPALALIRPEWSAGKCESLLEAGFAGFKPYPTFAPQSIKAGHLRIADFLTNEHLAVANRHRALVMLHIGGQGRLKDPYDLNDLMRIDQQFPDARVIVAHIGRAYSEADADGAWDRLIDSKHLLFDFSANTCSPIMQDLISCLGTSRILYGSDLPITLMRMSRTTRNGSYLNKVPKHLYGNLAGEAHMQEVDGPEADQLSLFLYEEILAFLEAAEHKQLSQHDLVDIFHDNAARLLNLPLLACQSMCQAE